MTLKQLTQWATDKSRFRTVEDYSHFGREYLAFLPHGLKTVIVARNENCYRFFQYGSEGNFNVSRPINSELMLGGAQFDRAEQIFRYALGHIREIRGNAQLGKIINRFIYTCQQSIGAALDALPAGQSNTARKINGDLFERYIRLILGYIGVEVRDGVVNVPVVVDGEEQFTMSYQHDLIVEQGGEVRAIGSVKTSSKDRLDKIFIDKFLYNRLTNTSTPHFAVFLNDVQRKGREPRFGVNTTFLTGHFKGYTVKLNPLDGVYYCDLRPKMTTDPLLRAHIRSLDKLFTEDIWNFLPGPGDPTLY